MSSVMSEKMRGPFNLNCDRVNVIGCDALFMEHLS